MDNDEGVKYLAEGTVTIEANGEIFHAHIKDGQKFSANLRMALNQGMNPAQAFIFLAEIGSKIDVLGYAHVKTIDKERWIKFFGKNGTGK